MKYGIINPKNKSGGIFVTGGELYRTPTNKDKEPVSIEDSKLVIVLKHDSSLKDIRESLDREIHAYSRIERCLFYLNTKLSAVIFLMISFSIVAAIGGVAVYGNALYDTITVANSTSPFFGQELTATQITVLLFFILSISFYLVPSIFKLDESEIGHSILSHINTKSSHVAALAKAISYLSKRGIISHIDIWNPTANGALPPWVWDGLIAPAHKARIEQDIFCFVQDIEYFKNRISEAFGKGIPQQRKKADYLPSNDLETELIVIDSEFLNDIEKIIIDVMIYCSTLNIPCNWGGIKDNDIHTKAHARNGVVSLTLTKCILLSFHRRLGIADLNSVEIASLFDEFIRRCTNDYNLLREYMPQWTDVWRFNSQYRTVCNVANKFYFISDYCISSVDELLPVVKDPIGTLIIASLNNSVGKYSVGRIRAIDGFLDSVATSEQYGLLRMYWDDLISAYSKGDSQKSEDLYVLLDANSLKTLVDSFERAGMFSEADSLYDQLIILYPITSGIGKARLQERQGKYSIAIDQLCAIKDKYIANNSLLRKDLELLFYLRFAWTIVSGRDLSFKDLGKQALISAKELKEELFIEEGGKQFADLVWHYHNSNAQYEEWDKRYDEAQSAHEICAKIPGVGQKWLSGTKVNLGVIHRLKARSLSSIDKHQAQIEYEKALAYGNDSVEIKSDIGDDDELPIALHNVALTALEFFFFSRCEDSIKGLIVNIKKNASRGLDILRKTGSRKKKGQLYAELYAASLLLSEIDKGTINDLLIWLKNPDSGDLEAVLEIIDLVSENKICTATDAINSLNVIDTSERSS